MKRKIPTINKVIEQKSITSPRISYVQHQFKQLQHQASIEGWCLRKYDLYRRLKTVRYRNKRNKKTDTGKK